MGGIDKMMLIEFAQKHILIYFAVAIIIWLLGCFVASLGENTTKNQDEPIQSILVMTLIAVIWPLVLSLVLYLGLFIATLFCAWVLAAHIFYTVICLPYFLITGYDNYLIQLSKVMPWEYYKKIKHENGAYKIIRPSDGMVVKIRYNTGDIVWFNDWYKKMPIKIKTHDGIVHKIY